MKHLLFIITVIFVLLTTVAYTFGRDTSDKKDPFAPLEKTANPNPAEVNDGNSTVSEPTDTLDTEVFNLNFANAEQMEKTFSKLVSNDGRVGIDSRLNSIVITDTTANLKRIRRTVSKLDIKSQQVMIEALIVNVKLTNQLKLGVDWTKLGTASNYLSQGLSLTSGTNPFGKVTFSTTYDNWNIQGLMDFIETNKDVRILANPKVLVLNNYTATIKTVKEIPYKELSQTSGGGNIGTTAFKEAGVTLEVTPQITEDGYIIMTIRPEQSAQIDTFILADNSEVPVIETRKADTTLRVKDGQTIIIGGLRERQPSIQENKVPLLGNVPIVGALFRNVNNELIESELGIFITPHIYTDGKLSENEKGLIKKGEENGDLYEAGDILRLQSKDKKNK
ncbi:MAG: secretin N-terminal domain-containing protein [Sedimentisphaerales bacterium]